MFNALLKKMDLHRLYRPKKKKKKKKKRRRKLGQWGIVSMMDILPPERSILYFGLVGVPKLISRCTLLYIPINMFNVRIESICCSNVIFNCVHTTVLICTQLLSCAHNCNYEHTFNLQSCADVCKYAYASMCAYL